MRAYGRAALGGVGRKVEEDGMKTGSWSVLAAKRVGGCLKFV